jgi:transposase
MEFTMITRGDAACFVGIDLHKDTLTACTIAAKDREVSYRKIACVAREKVREFLAGLPRPSVVAIETVGFYRWLWTEAEPLVDHVVLADARGCRALAGRRIKTDREDALNVAELLMTGRYAGLTPTGYASADKNRLGRICKTGSPDLRWTLQQAAWTAIRCDAGFKKTWLKISKTAGKKAAAVAIARKILVLMWAFVRKDELYKAREPIAA